VSSTGPKRDYGAALLDADEFRNLFSGCFEKWVFAGSLRRKCETVSDVEHAVVPKIIEVPGDGLFGETKLVNAVCRRSDELEAQGIIRRHVYGTSGFRWGERYRGCDFKGYQHEIFMCEAQSWGALLAIRTGPPDFSKTLVNNIRKLGRRNHDGKVWRCEPCGCGRRDQCTVCDNTGLKCVEVIPCPTEEIYFDLCGTRFISPENRR
jgi:hypothetical protein